MKQVLTRKSNRKASRPKSTTDTDDKEVELKNRVMKKKVGKVTRKGMKTSTPMTIQMKKLSRTRKRVTASEKDAFETVKQKLDEGLLVGLSSSSGKEYLLESTGSSLRDAVNAGALSVDSNDTESVADVRLDDYYTADNERDSAAKYVGKGGEDDERDSAAKYYENPN